MDAWMHFEAMLHDVFQRRAAYPYPFGSSSLSDLSQMSDAALRRLPYPRLRDQAVSVDMAFEYFKGHYMALHSVIEHQGMTPYLDEELSKAARSLRRIQVQQRRLQALLQEAPQPRHITGN